MKFSTLALSLALLAGCASAPPRPAAITRGDYAATQVYISDLIQHSMAQSKVTGLSIALIDDQRVVWSQGFGYANLEHKALATPDTLYRVASISKLFTGTAAMQLAERGLLDIDQPVSKVLPDFAPLAAPAHGAITPRQLMTHHSGLPRDKIQGFQSAAPAPFSDVVSYLNSTPTAYPPGNIFAYSNLGVTLLGSVVQKLSGTPFAQHMQQSVLAPLGMTDSSFDSSPPPAAQMSLGYKNGVVEKEWPLRDLPAAGLNSSAKDLAKFISMVFAGGRSGENQVLKPETVAEMMRPQNSAVPLDLNFQVGLGWMLSTLGKSTLQNAGPVAHHAGGIGSFHSQMYLLPQHKLGVVVLANSASAGEVVDHVATEALSLALEAKTGIQQPQPAQVAWADTPTPAATLQAAVGDYATALGLVTVSREGKNLRAQALGQSLDLRPRQDGLLGLDYALFGLFHIDLGPLSEVGLSLRPVAGRDLLIARIGTQEMRAGERIQAPADLGAWRQRLGDYEITNLADNAKFVERIRLVEERGFLIAQVELTEAPGQTLQIVLMPSSDSEARAVETLAKGGESLRVVTDNGVEQLLFSGYLLRKK
jgi:CubicO group peptidase (beta-lactamase class C family)/acetolactate synthase regulatory subunit